METTISVGEAAGERGDVSGGSRTLERGKAEDCVLFRSLRSMIGVPPIV